MRENSRTNKIKAKLVYSFWWKKIIFRLKLLLLSTEAFIVNTRNNGLDQWAGKSSSQVNSIFNELDSYLISDQNTNWHSWQSKFQGWDPSLNGDISRLLANTGIASNLKRFTNMKFSKRSPSKFDTFLILLLCWKRRLILGIDGFYWPSIPCKLQLKTDCICALSWIKSFNPFLLLNLENI